MWVRGFSWQCDSVGQCATQAESSGSSDYACRSDFGLTLQEL